MAEIGAQVWTQKFPKVFPRGFQKTIDFFGPSAFGVSLATIYSVNIETHEPIIQKFVANLNT